MSSEYQKKLTIEKEKLKLDEHHGTHHMAKFY